MINWFAIAYNVNHNRNTTENNSFTIYYCIIVFHFKSYYYMAFKWIKLRHACDTQLVLAHGKTL